MGSGTSKEKPVNVPEGHKNEAVNLSKKSIPRETRSHSPNAKPRDKKLQLFEKSVETAHTANVSFYYNSGEVDEETHELLTKSLKGFFLFSDDAVNADIIIRTMCKEEYSAGSMLISEGEPGSSLFIIQDGTLKVTINGFEIRQVTTGAMIGELALLYDAPRSATIRCETDVVVWSLERDVFKSVLASITANIQTEQSKMLIRSNELAILSPIDLSRLIATLQPKDFKEGDVIYEEGKYTEECLMIMDGEAKVYPSSETKIEGRTNIELENDLVLYRPQKQVPQTELNSHETYSDGNIVLDVGKGCLLGFGALRSVVRPGGSWEWNSEKQGAKCPYTIKAHSNMKCFLFTVAVVQRLFGDSLISANPSRNSGRTDIIADSAKSRDESKTAGSINQRIFQPGNFQMKWVLGSGSFGTVVLAEYRDDSAAAYETFALKILGKANLLELEQVNHVVDERKLLMKMENCPFIVKLYGTYQSAHKIVFVTEVLECGDLWSVIYEVPQHTINAGLPLALVTFYTASLVLALAHIHDKGVVYRDLKPENIMMAADGYLRIIDFGFSKEIPYSELDETKENSVIRYKSYTLCGTPEYLAPEFIFNMGHDSSSDLWALGVLIYEMILSGTPFAAKRPDNVSELFANIANVKKLGLNLSPSLEDKTAGSGAASLISSLLKPTPSERLSVQQGSTRFIIEHEFFKSLDISALERCQYPAPFVPTNDAEYDDLESIPAVKPYTGEQNLFEGF